MASSQLSYTTGENSQNNFNDAYTAGMVFLTVGGFTLTSVKVKLYRSATSGGTLTLSIRTVSAGYPSDVVLTSQTMNRNDVSTSSPGEWYEFNVTDYDLDAATQYAIVLTQDVAATTSWRADSNKGYTDGLGCSKFGGWSDSNMDQMFDLWGTATTYSELAGTITSTSNISGNLTLYTINELAGTIAATSSVSGNLGSTTVDLDPTATVFTKRLIVVGNNRIYSEDV